jgi:hypothetical protein
LKPRAPKPSEAERGMEAACLEALHKQTTHRMDRKFLGNWTSL